ncbi:MAG: CRISPR-associated protein Csx16 [bacterium]
MASYFVSRHPGAKAWAERQGMTVDALVEHLEVTVVQAGDVVIGTLPVNLAAEVCARRARYLHLILPLPPELRGRHLTAEDMARLGARLDEYRIERVLSKEE